MSNSTIKLGTRRSMLARAQSQWVATQIERLNPGVRVELVGIETQGDRIQDIPLSKIEGKDFFVAELDQALMRGEVDLTVHSMKDLSTVRPKEITLAAVPPREDPRDVLFFSPEILTLIKDKKPIRIGTSAPRRLDNLPKFLSHALPSFEAGSSAQIKFVEVRGNVNSRLERLSLPESDSKKCDAVVLALAGIQRLLVAADPNTQSQIHALIARTHWMLMPLDLAPTAPAQGALAVECRTNDLSTLEKIKKLHDPETAQAVASERDILIEWGGGCHQRLGATQIKHKTLGPLLYVKGTKHSGQKEDRLTWKEPPHPSGSVHAWDGSKLKSPAQELEISDVTQSAIQNAKSIFVAHARAYPSELAAPKAKQTLVWVSGTQSWFKLAARGFWVNGSAESLGFSHWFEGIRRLKLTHIEPKHWMVLTHKDAAHGWSEVPEIPTQNILATYQLKTASAPKELESASHVYWSSATQFETLGRFAKKAVHHACGPGKTAQHPKMVAFPHVEAWRKWLRLNLED